ncbi:MAG: hypothetical protein ACTSRC_19530, partial [Candidatus Helarchaeota archaeon]
DTIKSYINRKIKGIQNFMKESKSSNTETIIRLKSSSRFSFPTQNSLFKLMEYLKRMNGIPHIKLQ